MIFQNINDLSRFLSSAQGQKVLLDSAGIRRILESEAQRLKGLIQKQIDAYYASYSPKIYQRTFGLKGALRVGADIEFIPPSREFQIRVTFADEAVKRKGFGGNIVNVADLINFGWRVKKNVPFKNTEHFGWQDPFYFIEHAVAEFERNNPYNIRVVIQGTR